MADIGYATLSVIPSARGFGRALSSKVDPQLAVAGHSGGSVFARGLKTAALVGFGALAVGIGAVLSTGIGEAMDSSAGLAQLTAGLKSTNNAANVTVKGMSDLASSIQSMSGQTDDSIVKSEQLLLTFTKIRNQGPDKIFDRATLATANMAAKMGGDAAGAAIQLGKALNDPVKGLVGLGRAGVQFTDSQKASVKAMVESGNIMGAQKIILGELETQFGGAAKAAGESLPGQLNKAKRAFEDVSQSIVETILPLVLPALKGIADVITKQVMPAVQGFLADFKSGIGPAGVFKSVLTGVGSALSTVGGFLSRNTGLLKAGAIAFGLITAATLAHSLVLAINSGALAAWVLQTTIVRTATAAWAAIQWILNAALTANPIGLIIVGIAALVAGIILAYQNSETFRNVIQAVWSGIQLAVAAVVGFFQSYVMPVLSVVFEAISTYVRAVLTVYKFVWDAIWVTVETVVGWFQTYVMPTLSLVFTAISTYVKAVLTVYQAVWTGIQTAVRVVVEWFTASVWPAIKTQIDFITGGFTAMKDFIVGIWNGVVSFLGTIVTKFTDIGGQIVEGIKTGFSNAWGSFMSWIQEKIDSLPWVAKKVLGIASPSKVFAEIGGNVVAGLKLGLNGLDEVTADANKRMARLTSTTDDINASMRGIVGGRSQQNGSLDNASRSEIAAAVNGTRDSELVAEMRAMREEYRRQTDSLVSLKRQGMIS